MNDWSAEVTGTYGLQVENLRKGRGAWILETDGGLKLLKEYKGSVKRLEFEEQVLAAVNGQSGLKVDQYQRNLEGGLLSVAEDGTKYIVKDWFSDRECNLKDMREVLFAVRQTAMLHRLFRNVCHKEEWNLKSMVSPPLYEAMERHNREFKKARAFIRGKRKKSEFELCVIASYDEFYQQAAEAKEGMEALFLKEGKTLMEQYHVCHGDLDQHHLLMGDTYVAVTEFSRMHLGLQVEDLYHFLRKVMEKNDWDRALGRAMLEAYERVLPFGSLEKKCLYYLFLYPEKYWKQMNFYYNANKAWIPVRNTEKLLGLKRQQEARMRFVNSLVN